MSGDAEEIDKLIAWMKTYCFASWYSEAEWAELKKPEPQKTEGKTEAEPDGS